MAGEESAPKKSLGLETESGKSDSEKANSAKLESEKASDRISPQSSDEGDPGESTTQSSAGRIPP